MNTLQNPNQTLETVQLTNKPQQNQTFINTPQGIQPNIQVNPTVNPSIQGGITISPIIQTQQAPQISIKPSRTITRPNPINVGLEPETMNCPFCSEPIETQVTNSTNMKSILVGIASCFVGLALFQICNNKNVGCQDAEHKCPKCGYKIGCYYAM